MNLRPREGLFRGSLSVAFDVEFKKIFPM